MQTEEFWDKVRQIWEDAFNKGDLDALDEIIAPDYVRHMPPFQDIVGLNGIKQYIQNSRGDYPDLKLTFTDYVGQDKTFVAEWKFEGTRTGISPTTGETRPSPHVVFEGCNVEQYEDGKVVETRVYGDWVSFLQQLDIIPHLF